MEVKTPIESDTIFALSSAVGKAGVAVVRVSGERAWHSLQTLTRNQSLPKPRQTKLMSLTYADPTQNSIMLDVIDKAMVIGFKAPHSFTGEDVVEYHCHGSSAIMEELFAILAAQPHHRMAQHGEFTRRAFENGKLDLTEAEAIADLIDAETKIQKEQALLQMGGHLSRLYHDWAKELTKALAYVEAIIDFPDEDVPDTETAKAKPAIETLQRELAVHLNDGRKGERLRNGIELAVIGAPNAGKSSLVNLLAQRDIAIVSDIAGTTRDVIEAHLNLGGYPVIISDTAGLRPDQISEKGQEGIESEGIQRALQKAKTADIRLLVFDGTSAEADSYSLDLIDDNAVVIVNKADVHNGDKNLFHVKQDALQGHEPLFISVTSGQGIGELIEHLTVKIAEKFSVSRETPSLTRERHRQHLEQCQKYLSHALAQSQPELMAQDLRFAVNTLGRITGRVDVEDLLDVIFKDFCIGK
jgi:tRNA modification GTPase